MALHECKPPEAVKGEGLAYCYHCGKNIVWSDEDGAWKHESYSAHVVKPVYDRVDMGQCGDCGKPIHRTSEGIIRHSNGPHADHGHSARLWAGEPPVGPAKRLAALDECDDCHHTRVMHRSKEHSCFVTFHDGQPCGCTQFRKAGEDVPATDSVTVPTGSTIELSVAYKVAEEHDEDGVRVIDSIEMGVKPVTRELTGQFTIGQTGWTCTIDGCDASYLSGDTWIDHLTTHGIETVEVMGVPIPPRIDKGEPTGEEA
jgi:hypothetical protein